MAISMTRIGAGGRTACGGFREQRGPSISLLGYIAAGNIGNDASFEAVVDFLSREVPNVQLCLITNCPQEARRRYGLRAESMTAGASRWASRLGRIGRALAKFGDMRHLYREVRKSDVIVVPGMGVFEESLPMRAWGLPLSLVTVGLACRLTRTPLLLLAVGAESPVDWRVRRLFRWTIRAASIVSARDSVSAQALALLLGENVEEVPDLAFSHKVTPQSSRRESLLIVGVMGGDWDRAYGSRLPLQGVYEREMARFCRDAMVLGHTVILTGGEREADYPVAQRIAEQCSPGPGARMHGPTVVFVDGFSELVDLMATADVVIASRYHNLIAGLMAERRTLSISYAPKCDDLMVSFGMSPWCTPIRSVDASELTKMLGLVLLDEQVEAGIRVALERSRISVEEHLSIVFRSGLGL